MIIYTIPVGEVIKFTILLTRIGGIMAFMPFFNSLNVPVSTRIAFVLGLSWLLYPVLSPALKVPALGLGSMTVLIGGELLIGLLIGLISRFLFVGFELAGQLLGFQMGFSMINAIDPQTQVQTTVLSVSQSLLGLLVFLGLDGHHWLITAVCESFIYLAPLKLHLPSSVSGALLQLSGEMFVIGFKLAAPVLVVLTLTDVIFAIIGRAAPQVQIMIIGLPLKNILGFFLLSISFYFVPIFVSQYLTTLHGRITALLHLLVLK
ncbi:MAG: flagellar biosynthetic protein FliR [Acidobacteria bacterium]|nr:flagellar biosynthetic protein FliR [Acidobacteriota bacterium]